MFDTLLSLPLFQGMTVNDFDTLLRKMRLDFVRYEAGETIITAGDRCSSFAFILSGNVMSSRNGVADRYTFHEVLAAPYLIEPYSMFGRAGSYQRSYTAMEQVSMLHIDKQYVYTEIGRYNICRMNLLNMLSGRMQQADNYIWNLDEMDLRQRIVHFIKGLCDVRGGEKRLEMKMSELAVLMDATRINVSKYLNEMAQEELITLKRGVIIVPDLDRLH